MNYKNKNTKFSIKLINSQKELIFLLAKGQTLKDIAKNLQKNHNNIKKRTQNLYKKFNVNTRKSLINRALELKIIRYKDIAPKFRKRFFKREPLVKDVKYSIINSLELKKEEMIFLNLLKLNYTRKEIIAKMNLRNMHDCNYLYYCVLNKLNAKNAVQAILSGIKNGIINN